GAGQAVVLGLAMMMMAGANPNNSMFLAKAPVKAKMEAKAKKDPKAKKAPQAKQANTKEGKAQTQARPIIIQRTILVLKLKQLLGSHHHQASN
ncbi:MAG: hypothetical protein EBZ36_18365, partial [Acidobacteria bacterium]|nr:hypothetical protein [Acidobacteriota bacterium]